VRVTDRSHALYGQSRCVFPERSGRGSSLVFVDLGDGRSHVFERALTHIDGAEAAAILDGKLSLPLISVRTLVPLARHLTAMLVSLEEEVSREEAHFLPGVGDAAGPGAVAKAGEAVRAAPLADADAGGTSPAGPVSRQMLRATRKAIPAGEVGHADEPLSFR
jgi:hypothetical protein